MSRYLSITAIQYPFDIGPDENKRAMFSCNYDVTAAGPIANLEGELVGLIVAAGLGVYGTTLLVGRRAQASTGNGPYVHLIITSGYSPLQTHTGEKYERPSFQIVTRAADYFASRDRALAIHRLLDGQHNVSVSA